MKRSESAGGRPLLNSSAFKRRQRSRMRALVRKILTQLAPMKQQHALSSNTLRPRLNGSRIWFPLAQPAASRQMLDDARRAEHAARESLTAAAAQRAAAEKGPRAQEIAAADAAAEAAAASLAALDYQIHRGAVLTAPSAGIIRARLAEPGDMASPSRTIYQLSVADPKWIRAYLTERQLGLVKEGTLATVFTDTVGPVDGTVAFVSDTAEFTPKTVQTEDLRASLVYEVRITVRDPENRLRLGQPVTVEFAQPRSSPHD